MDKEGSSRKDTGVAGERVAAEYLRRLGFAIIARNIARKTGELDVIAQKGETIHFVEVKTVRCNEFPGEKDITSTYDPGYNLHAHKIQKVARTAQWYIADIEWEGEWQIDGALVWLRRRDGRARIRYYPQVL